MMTAYNHPYFYGLYDAIVRSPDDNLPRLMFADFLLENGNESESRWGELIMLQIAQDAASRTGGDVWYELIAHEHDLLPGITDYPLLLGDLPERAFPDEMELQYERLGDRTKLAYCFGGWNDSWDSWVGCSFCRGFPGVLSMNYSMFRDRGRHMALAAPIVRWEFTDKKPYQAPLGSRPNAYYCWLRYSHRLLTSGVRLNLHPELQARRPCIDDDIYDLIAGEDHDGEKVFRSERLATEALCLASLKWARVAPDDIAI